MQISLRCCNTTNRLKMLSRLGLGRERRRQTAKRPLIGATERLVGLCQVLKCDYALGLLLRRPLLVSQL